MVNTFLGKLKKDGLLEMFTHHMICLMLCVMNVLTNRLEVTIGLIFACSLTDILMSFTRLISETKYCKFGGYFAILVLVPFWIYSRLIAYPLNLYNIIIEVIKFNDNLKKS